MFDFKSRYNQVPDVTVTTSSGQLITYKSRRFLPSDSQQVISGQITVSVGDRLDLIAARIYGDPLKFWQICDANSAMNPLALIQLGQVLQITLPTE